MKNFLILVCCLILSACATVEPKPTPIPQGMVMVNEARLKEAIGMCLDQEQIMKKMQEELEELRDFKEKIFEWRSL